MIPLIIVRPEPGASETAARAAARGLRALVSPLFAITPVAWQVPDPDAYFGLLLSSANAVIHGGAGLTALRYMPVFAVGERTADAARDAGFGMVVAGDGDVQRLLSRIAGVGPQHLLHLCGADVTEVNVAGITIDRRITYRAVATTASDELIAALQQPAVVMLHSTRAARALAAIACPRDKIAIAAISSGVAASAGDGWRAVSIADAPRDDKMVDIAERLCTP